MAEEYKRTLCVACPSEAECRALRENTHCDSCTETLVCGTQGLLGRHDCLYVRHLWGALPRKCLLVGSRLKEQKVDPMELFTYVKGASSDDEEPVACFVCPRCGQPELTVGKQHTFRSQLERLSLKSRCSTLGVAYYASCRVCGVDDVHKT